MNLRSVILFVVLAGCKTDEAKKPEAKASRPAPVAPKPTPRVAERAPTPSPRPPSLPATPTDFNPAGIRHVDGPIQEGEQGLQYVDEVVGTGAAPEKGKSVKVHYTGYFTDGTEFDSSHTRDTPIEIPFDAGVVIKGWDLGIASMRAGGKRRLLIPAAIAYGEQGMGEAIPPDAVLLFDIELLEVGGK